MALQVQQLSEVVETERVVRVWPYLHYTVLMPITSFSSCASLPSRATHVQALVLRDLLVERQAVEENVSVVHDQKHHERDENLVAAKAGKVGAAACHLVEVLRLILHLLVLELVHLS